MIDFTYRDLRDAVEGDTVLVRADDGREFFAVIEKIAPDKIMLDRSGNYDLNGISTNSICKSLPILKIFLIVHDLNNKVLLRIRNRKRLERIQIRELLLQDGALSF